MVTHHLNDGEARRLSSRSIRSQERRQGGVESPEKIKHDRSFERNKYEHVDDVSHHRSDVRKDRGEFNAVRVNERRARDIDDKYSDDREKRPPTATDRRISRSPDRANRQSRAEHSDRSNRTERLERANNDYRRKGRSRSRSPERARRSRSRDKEREKHGRQGSREGEGEKAVRHWKDERKSLSPEMRIDGKFEMPSSGKDEDGAGIAFEKDKKKYENVVSGSRNGQNNHPSCAFSGSWNTHVQEGMGTNFSNHSTTPYPPSVQSPFQFAPPLPVSCPPPYPLASPSFHPNQLSFLPPSQSANGGAQAGSLSLPLSRPPLDSLGVSLPYSRFNNSSYVPLAGPSIPPPIPYKYPPAFSPVPSSFPAAATPSQSDRTEIVSFDQQGVGGAKVSKVSKEYDPLSDCMDLEDDESSEKYWTEKSSTPSVPFSPETKEGEAEREREDGKKVESIKEGGLAWRENESHEGRAKAERATREGFTEGNERDEERKEKEGEGRENGEGYRTGENASISAEGKEVGEKLGRSAEKFEVRCEGQSLEESRTVEKIIVGKEETKEETERGREKERIGERIEGENEKRKERDGNTERECLEPEGSTREKVRSGGEEVREREKELEQRKESVRLVAESGKERRERNLGRDGEMTGKEEKGEEETERERERRGEKEKKQKVSSGKVLSLLKERLTAFVKERLKPKYDEGALSREDFKHVAKRSVEKVMQSLVEKGREGGGGTEREGRRSKVPHSEKQVESFMASREQQDKIRKLVEAYAEKQQKASQRKDREEILEPFSPPVSPII